ncbi:tetratricopeptide repeat protein [Fusobacterium periodonticum ATCC 33693]|uniref:Tetratricopeptide repeat protein n=1 Tax=Fusobacterium periodonticum ATCC 33693 TaxID=546275 RepID=D4CTG6_9FUSO|nr:tetratricopeptide repeat protein [Fusobacterium periodonticum ATCC 33693]
MKILKEKLLEKIERLIETKNHQEIINLIEALPTEQLDTELIGELGRAYNNVGNYQKGLEILKSIENEEGNTALWNWRVGYSYFFLKDFISAKKCLLKAYELNPHDNTICDLLIITYANLSKLENKNGNSEKAIEYALESRKYSYDEKGIMEADSFLAWLYNKYKEYTKAEEILRKQLARNKDDKWTLSELAYSLSAQGKYEEAIEKFEYVLSLEVEDEGNLEFIYSQLGWCYRHLWNFEKALEYLNKAKELGRKDVWINVEMTLCYQNLEDYEKALEYALIAYELDRNDVHVLSELGVIYGCMEKYEEALSFLIKAEKLDKNDEWINTEIAINLGRSGKVNEGIERLKKSLTMVGEDDIDRKIIINSELAWFYGKLDEPKIDVALKHLNKAKELGRDDEWLHSEMGYQLGQNPETSKEALEHFEKAMKLGRKDAWIFEMMACTLFNLDRYEEALDYFRKAYAEKNDNWYLYSMGNCLRALERYEEAIEVLLESRQISLAEKDEVDGEDFELAYCYIGIGDKENAQKYLDSARDSVIKQGTLDEYIKEDIEEIEERIRSLDN